MSRLEGRIALITAAGSGMGRASAIRFAEEGAHVIVADLDQSKAEAVVGEIAAAGGAAESATCDVSDVDQIRGLIDRVEREHGILHVLFNHAGIPGKAGLEMSEADFQLAVDVNLRGAFFATSFAEPLLRKASGTASIIYTASTSGVVGSPFSPLYSMTKGGIVVFMRAVAVRLGPAGIRSNAICPAMIDTPMLSQFFGREEGADIDDLKGKFMESVPLSRSAKPEEMASVAAFLASDDASWVTGVALPVDGGLLAK
ncbi:MAG: SDR family NAD(P)-dependent oxidoreductase [Solirubrobacterales bacterium]